MKTIRKSLAILLTVLMVLSVFSACASTQPTSNGQGSVAGAGSGTGTGDGKTEMPSKTFTMNVSENMKTLDPHYQTTMIGKVFTQMYLEPLLMFDDSTGDFYPWLCETYEYSDDGLEWTFHMRDGIKFSDGEVLDANDIAYSFERLMADKEGSPIAARYWAELEKVELIDNLTVKLVMGVPRADMRVSLFKTMIIPEDAHKAQGDDLFHNQACQGSGPWVLDEWIDGQHITFHKNENYWNNGFYDSYYDKVVIRMITEASTAITSHVSGDVQAYIPTGGINVDMLPLYAGTESKTNVFSFLSGAFVYAGMSFKEGSPFNDENFRWAFEYAINRQGLVDNVLGGGVVPNSQALVVYLGYNPDLEPYVYDPALAKEHLAKSSYNGEPFEIVTNNAYNKSEDIALYLSECLNEIGMNTSIRIVEVAELMSIRKTGDYTVFLVENMNGCGDIGNDMIQRLVQDTHHSFYSGPGYDELAAAVIAQSTELDVVKRAELIAEAQSIIRKNAAPHSYLCEYESAFAIDYGVTGLEPFTDGTFRFTFVTYDPDSKGNELPNFAQWAKP